MKPLELEYLDGPHAGKRIIMSSSQMKFGRVGGMDVALSWDRHVSSEHFCIHFVEGHYIMEDLGSRNGTSVNEQVVRRWQLADGDVILVGRTSLRAHLASNAIPVSHSLDSLPFLIVNGSNDGAYASKDEAYASSDAAPEPFRTPSSEARVEHSQEPAPEAPKAKDATALIKPLRTLPPLEAIRESIENDLVLLAGDCPEDCGGLWLRSFQSSDERLYAILDPGKNPSAGSLYPLVEPLPLFDWLDEAAQNESPVLIDVEAQPEWGDLVDEYWDSEAIVVLRSRLKQDELAAILRSIIRGNSGTIKLSHGILGVCWPSIMQAVLRTGQPDFPKKLFEHISLVIVEQADKAQAWQAIAPKDVIDSIPEGSIRIRKPKPTLTT